MKEELERPQAVLSEDLAPIVRPAVVRFHVSGMHRGTIYPHESMSSIKNAILHDPVVLRNCCNEVLMHKPLEAVVSARSPSGSNMAARTLFRLPRSSTVYLSLFRR